MRLGLWYYVYATQNLINCYLSGNVLLFWQKRILRFAFPVGSEKILCSNKWGYAFFGV